MPARTQLIDTRARLLVDREKALIAELGRANIRMPKGEMLDLKPRTLSLGRTPAARTAALNELLRREPPRRTVTGSFRPH